MRLFSLMMFAFLMCGLFATDASARCGGGGTRGWVRNRPHRLRTWIHHRPHRILHRGCE